MITNAFMRVNGRMIRGMAKGTNAINQGICMKVNSKTTKHMEKASTNGRKERCTMVNGVKGRRRVMEYGEEYLEIAT
jgi:hypothetical protein